MKPCKVRATCKYFIIFFSAPLADLVNNPIELKYEDLPHFPKSTAPGHKSRMISGTLNEIPVLLMQGRFHLYEGYSIHKVSLVGIYNRYLENSKIIIK